MNIPPSHAFTEHRNARPNLCAVANYCGAMGEIDGEPQLHIWTLLTPLPGLLVGSTYAEGTLTNALGERDAETQARAEIDRDNMRKLMHGFKAATEPVAPRLMPDIEPAPRRPAWREGPHDEAMFGPLRREPGYQANFHTSHIAAAEAKVAALEAAMAKWRADMNELYWGEDGIISNAGD